MSNDMAETVQLLREENASLQQRVQELEEKEVELRKLYRAVEQSPASIVITDILGNIEYVNPKFTQVTGYTTEEAYGQNPRILKSGELSPEEYKNLWEKVTAGKEWRGEFHNKKKDGEMFWEYASISPIFNSDGIITHFVAVKEEITERKRMEAELQSAYHHLKKLTDQLRNELHIARRIQQNLLPPAQPKWTQLDVMCYCAPARDVGGDFYTYHVFDTPQEQRFSFAVGDVSGKGMPAALLMAVSLATFKIIISQAYTINEVLTDLMTQAYSMNEFLSDLDEAISPYTMTTRQNCALAYVEIIKRQPPDEAIILRSFNAGCIMPILRRGDGTITWIEAYGLPLGVGLSAETEYRHVAQELSPGDMVIMCSDGIVEATNNHKEMFGFERLEQAIATGPTSSANAMLHHLRNAMETFTHGTEPHDDVTLVVIRA